MISIFLESLNTDCKMSPLLNLNPFHSGPENPKNGQKSISQIILEILKKAFDILFLTSKTTSTMIGIQVKGQILAFKGQI